VGNIIVVLIVVHMHMDQTQAADALLIHKHNAVIHTDMLLCAHHIQQQHVAQLIQLMSAA